MTHDGAFNQVLSQTLGDMPCFKLVTEALFL